MIRRLAWLSAGVWLGWRIRGRFEGATRRFGLADLDDRDWWSGRSDVPPPPPAKAAPAPYRRG